MSSPERDERTGRILDVDPKALRKRPSRRARHPEHPTPPDADEHLDQRACEQLRAQYPGRPPSLTAWVRLNMPTWNRTMLGLTSRWWGVTTTHGTFPSGEAVAGLETPAYVGMSAYGGALVNEHWVHVVDLHRPGRAAWLRLSPDLSMQVFDAGVVGVYGRAHRGSRLRGYVSGPFGVTRAWIFPQKLRFLTFAG